MAVLITFGHIVAGGVHLGGAPQPAVGVRVRRTAIVLCTLIFSGGMVIALKNCGFCGMPTSDLTCRFKRRNLPKLWKSEIVHFFKCVYRVKDVHKNDSYNFETEEPLQCF